ncbi:hypothetical protein OHB53_09565 [Streptomyces sp. NBC_00056]|uniref:hypothetical protein n=1 Tax=Streptomyces sp. NBC_00056 TaxID=2975633 RepID=UPI003247D98E
MHDELRRRAMRDAVMWGEGLIDLALMAVIPTVVGGAIVLSLVGLTMWVTAPIRRRRRTSSNES